MRARMGILISGISCELREVVLRNKPQDMLDISPKGTVPVLHVNNDHILDESLDIMCWALSQNDPENWLCGDVKDMKALIQRNDHSFKTHLDRYKYSARFEGSDPLIERTLAEVFIGDLEKRLFKQDYLFGQTPCLSDYAIFPFIRQFANVDRAWFDTTPYENVQKWLSGFLDSTLFANIMHKYNPWQKDQPIILFK